MTDAEQVGLLEPVDAPLRIGRVLLELAERHAPLCFEPAGRRHIATRLLAADPAARTCVFDWCRNGAELEAILSARALNVSGSLRGATIRFTIDTPVIERFDGWPAFVAPFPRRLYRVGRPRRHFRAGAQAGRGYRAEIEVGDGQVAELDIVDLSVSGVGLQARHVASPPLTVGAAILSCRLHVGPHGAVEVALQVVRHRFQRDEHEFAHRFGCTFCDVDGQTQKRLQRLVFALEVATRDDGEEGEQGEQRNEEQDDGDDGSSRA